MENSPGSEKIRDGCSEPPEGASSVRPFRRRLGTGVRLLLASEARSDACGWTSPLAQQVWGGPGSCVFTKFSGNAS